MSNKYIPTIGIETHVQLATKSKLFCSCSNDAREAAPNTLVCPVCMGFPGTLPVLNHQAIRLALRAGLALNGEIAGETQFDRKNYFYPDLPKGYQITQMDHPIVGKGSVEFPLNGSTIKVGITRAHLEEDAGKLTHPPGADYSLVDLNRTGTPLLEIVSEPEMHTAAEAKAYAQEVHSLMRYAGVSDADLYHGNMRFDVNVSVALEGDRGTRTETKNLNSFKAVERTVEYEVKRQSELLEKGEKIAQETRGWDEAKGKTFSQRSKEEAHDYRYFPEPDLPPVVVTGEMLAEAKRDLPMMPNEIRSSLSKAGIGIRDQETLVGDPQAAILLLRISKESPQYTEFAVNWLLGDRIRLQDETGKDLGHAGVHEGSISYVASMVSDGRLSSTNAKALLESLWNEGIGMSENDKAKWRGNLAANISSKVEEQGLLQVSDSGALEEIAAQVIKDNHKIVGDYRAGNERALQALVGQVMKASKGQANPAMVGDILKQKLEK